MKQQETPFLEAIGDGMVHRHNKIADDFHRHGIHRHFKDWKNLVTQTVSLIKSLYHRNKAPK